MILNGVTAEVFTESGGVYTAQNFNQNKLVDIGTQFVLTDSTGNRITFEDFSSGDVPRRRVHELRRSARQYDISNDSNERDH